ncbi:MAG: hypothetical protein KatS3mg031_0512 [Chitinophagales bacterium]|nr:MAG: hypothetical protein KatS3mg031_0512 [Chitinophagales bacterium]
MAVHIKNRHIVPSLHTHKKRIPAIGTLIYVNLQFTELTNIA